eukprot:g11090.t1
MPPSTPGDVEKTTLSKCLAFLRDDGVVEPKYCPPCRGKILGALDDARVAVKVVNGEHDLFKERFQKTGMPEATAVELLHRVSAALKRQADLQEPAKQISSQCRSAKKKLAEGEEEEEPAKIPLPELWMQDPNAGTTEACPASLVLGRLDLKSGTVEGAVEPNNEEINVDADESGFIDGRSGTQETSFLELLGGVRKTTKAVLPKALATAISDATDSVLSGTTDADCYEGTKFPETHADCEKLVNALKSKKLCQPTTPHGLEVCGKCYEIFERKNLEMKTEVEPDQRKAEIRKTEVSSGDYGGPLDVKNAGGMSKELMPIAADEKYIARFTRLCRRYAEKMPPRVKKVHVKPWRIPDQTAVEALEPSHCLGAAVEGKIDMKTGEVTAKVYSNTGNLDVEFDREDGKVKKGHFVPGKIISTAGL